MKSKFLFLSFRRLCLGIAILKVFKWVPAKHGHSHPHCDLQISLRKTRNVSTSLFMLSELLNDDSKLHPAKHVD